MVRGVYLKLRRMVQGVVFNLNDRRGGVRGVCFYLQNLNTCIIQSGDSRKRIVAVCTFQSEESATIGKMRLGRGSVSGN